MMMANSKTINSPTNFTSSYILHAKTPSVSQALYRRTISEDYTCKRFPSMTISVSSSISPISGGTTNANLSVEAVSNSERKKELMNDIRSSISNCLSETHLDLTVSGLHSKIRGKVRDIYDGGEYLVLVTTDRQSAFDRVLASIPFKGQIKVSNSALISAFMTELEPDTPVTQSDYDRLQFSATPFLERNVDFLIECMDDLSMEQQKFQFYYRNLSRQQAQQQNWLQNRRSLNISRKNAGEEPLPEEDPSNPIFKPIPEPSRLESFLITNQIANYCNQINGVAGQNFSRLYLAKALHEN